MAESKSGEIAKKWNDALEKRSKRSRQVPAYIRGPLLVLALAVQAYSVWSFSGPYAWIANFQADLMDGEHYMTLSFVLSLLIVLLPVVAIMFFLAPIYEGKKEKDQEDILDAP